MDVQIIALVCYLLFGDTQQKPYFCVQNKVTPLTEVTHTEAKLDVMSNR